MFKPLTDGVWVAGALSKADVARAAAEGVRTIVNNRPDGEAPDQLSHADAQAAAAASGLAYHYLPVRNGQLTVETVDAMRALLGEADAPILAYCASGTRSTFLWAFAVAPELAATTIVGAAGRAGYDLRGIAPQLEALHGR